MLTARMAVALGYEIYLKNSAGSTGQSMRTILVTGGAGFIGANLVNYLIEKYPDDRIVVLDILTYAGSIEYLPKEMLHGQHPKRRFWYGNRCNAALVATLVKEADAVIHLAAD